jgi:hypothetical protein
MFTAISKLLYGWETAYTLSAANWGDLPWSLVISYRDFFSLTIRKGITSSVTILEKNQNDEDLLI